MLTLLVSILAILLLLIPVHGQGDNLTAPTFFISLTSRCRFNDVQTDPIRNLAETGSLCAYAPDANILWVCGAGDAMCWNEGTTCSNGLTSAGLDQIACSDIEGGSVHWCCNSQYGNCTQTPYQQNNCWSNFDNPNRNYNSLAASSMASVAMQAAIAEPTVTNIVVRTLADGGWEISTTSNPATTQLLATSTSVGSTKSGSSTASGTGSTPIQTSLSSPRTESSTSQVLSVGAVVGIVLGAAVASALLATAATFFFLRRQKSRQTLTEKQDTTVSSEPTTNGQYYQSNGGLFVTRKTELSSESAGNTSYSLGPRINELDGMNSPQLYERPLRD